MVSGDTSADNSVSGYITNEQITLTVTDASPSSIRWGQAIPSASTPARSGLDDDDVAQVVFTPDVGGFYTITAVVDGTTYVLRISVASAAQNTVEGSLGFQPLTDASIPTPSSGRNLYYSSDEADLVTKDSSGTVRKVLQGAATGAEYGSLYFSTPAATTLANPDEWTKAGGTTTLGPANEFTMPANNRLRHDDADTETYHVAFTGSMTCAGENQVVWIGLSKNGATPAEGSWRPRTIGAGTDYGNVATEWLFSLASTDYVELWVKNATSTNSPTVETGALVAHKFL